MLYNDFKGLKLSALGMGAMRLPIKGSYREIDEEKTFEMVDYAMSRGVNYFDTAWGYHDGASELVMGKALSAYPRESYYLATKFPGYDLSNMDKAEQIFEKQLEKCGVDYFDFYLFHNVCEMNINQYLSPEYGIFDYLKKQKENGRIKHLGFSAHGKYDVIKRFLEAFGKDMEFCQLQVNWLDWTFQEANKKLELLKEYGLPLWVMEPLRGGKLAALTPDSENRLKELRPEETVPGWAFRFLQSVPETVVTLSGMSDFNQLKDNIKTFETYEPLNERELSTLADLALSMTKTAGVPCTACRYCTSHCPQALDIPYLLELYNEQSLTGGGFIAPMAMMAIPPEKQPSACIGCRSCQAVCPQGIKISEALSDFAQKLN